jgi:hypothetical protein
MSLLSDQDIALAWIGTRDPIALGGNFKDNDHVKNFAANLEDAILAKLASAELPEWSKRDDLGGLVPSEIRQALRMAQAQGAASQLSAEPSGFLSQHNLEMLKQGYPQTIVMLEGAKRDVPLFTLKEPK